ncbi:MAG: hypothetical protein IK090_05935 [Clostridia bacterium]|nr:hypothetical protein [Clostridia bacterium]
MQIVNKELGFTYDVPDDFKEIPKEKYKEYNIEEGTLGVFVKLIDGVPFTISLNRDDDAPDEKTYKELVDENAFNMKRMGMTIIGRVERAGKRAKIDVLYSEFKGLRFVTYFTTICGIMVACSTEIKEKDDEFDKTVAALFESIKEI